MPLIKPPAEYLFRCSRQGKSERSQCLTSRQIRPAGEIPSNDPDLMEVAHLHGNIAENLAHTAFSVKNSHSNLESLTLQSPSTFAVYGCCFSRRRIPDEVLFQMRGTEYAHTKCPLMECHIRNNHNRLRRYMDLSDRCGIKLSANPSFASLMIFRQLGHRLFLPHILAPKCTADTTFSSLILKLFSTFATLVSLLPTECSILLCAARGTIRAFFCKP